METNLDPERDLLRYHKKGTDYIKNALSIDETSKNKNDAIDLYKLGIEEFLRGLNVQLIGSSVERGMRIQEKMESNLAMALERVEALSNASPRLESLKKKIERTRVERMKSLNESSREKRVDIDCLDSNPAEFGQTSRSLRSNSGSKDNSRAKNSVSSLKPSVRPNVPVSSKAIVRPASTNLTAKKVGQPSTTTPAGPKISIGKKLKIPNVDDKLIEFILDEIVDSGQTVKFSDIAGQEKAKQALNELVILPALNPDLFTGLRSPVKGLLLFGPPGNGKTMLAKAVASEANCKFFNITAASLTSKYVGEGEKLVRALFALALYIQPSIVFIDEIDSLLFERKENDHEASRRLKTEFLSQFDGMQSNSQDKILVMGATNRPFELDNAALRRFPKRIYIGLPDKSTRISLINKLLRQQTHSLRDYQIDELARLTDGYSGSDLTSLAKDASLGPIREQTVEQLKVLNAKTIRPMCFDDFRQSVNKIRQSTPKIGLVELEKWNREFGDINV